MEIKLSILALIRAAKEFKRIIKKIRREREASVVPVSQNILGHLKEDSY
jgi:hypothetical protein